MSSIRIETWVVISIFVLLLFLIPGINHGLWRPDEPRVAGICAEMARTHDFVIPHLNGKPFLEKPPLYYAAGALAGSLLGGDSDIPYRLVSLFIGVLTIIITFLTASRKGGPIMGLIAGGILASTWEFFMLCRWIQVDVILVFGVTMAMYAYQKWLDSAKAAYSIMLGLAAGIAFMGKGMVGPAIVASAILADIIRRRDLSTFRRIRPFVVLAFILIAVLPWIVALWNRGGWSFIREVIVVNNLMRFTGAPEGAALGHQNGPLYYLEHFPGNFLPWTLIFIPAFIASIRKFKDDPYICWFIAPFILLSIASTKRGLYLVPLYPAAACMTTDWIVNAHRMKWEELIIKITRAVCIAGCLAPFAGAFLGMPVLGIAFGVLAVFSLVLITRTTVKQQEAVSLVMMVCIAMCACTMIYFPYMKPDKDYLGFAQQALATAGNSEITLIDPDESLEGVFPLVTGKTAKEMSSRTDIRDEGFYLLAGNNDTFMKALQQRSKVEVFMERKLGQKTTRLLFIRPDTAGKKPNI